MRDRPQTIDKWKERALDKDEAMRAEREEEKAWSSNPFYKAATPSAPKKARATVPHQSGPILGAKPTLLTPSQKKANHIQSEQKRRANIRRGYEALCETVPALREAIRIEDEAQAAANAAGGRSRSKKKSRSKKSEQAEKIDGRAGPRSENIVLQKSQSICCA